MTGRADSAGRVKTAGQARVELSHLMRPQHANFAGHVHGGAILGLMDEVAYVCASRFAEAYCVTAAVDLVEFLAPIRVGDIVTLRAAVNDVGHTSMDVGVQVLAEDPRRPGSRRRTNRCVFTMVALDEQGRPTPVPALKCETAEDVRWQCEAQLRKTLRQRYKKDLVAGACEIDPVPNRPAER